jgi:hypothetical protein
LGAVPAIKWKKKQFYAKGNKHLVNDSNHHSYLNKWSNMKTFWLILVVSLFMPFIVFGDVETITATHKYVMGDNDSKNDARRMCFMEAKRKVLEKAGSYIESNTTIRNYQLAKDEIIAYSAALLKIETVDEKWEIAGSNMAVTMTVKADVDASILQKQLEGLQKDKSAREKIKQQSSRLLELERTVNYLKKQLGSNNSPKAPVLRKERNVVFKEIDVLEEKKTAIIKRIQKRSRDAKKHIIKGMTQDDVKSILGQPDKIDTGVDHDQWFYGSTKIEFWYDIVHSIRGL